jgi:hypothetical protein
MKLEVECYSGFKADERPVRFRLNERQYLVEEIVDQWYGTQDVFYKVRADDASLYILRRETSTPKAHGIWCHLAKCRLNGNRTISALSQLPWVQMSTTVAAEVIARLLLQGLQTAETTDSSPRQTTGLYFPTTTQAGREGHLQ